MKELLESAKRKIFEKETEKRIKRIFSEEIPLIKEYKNRYNSFTAFLHSYKLFLQSLKLKVIDKRNTSLYTTTEALRLLLEEELDYFNIRKIRYRTDFNKAISIYFPYLFKIGEIKETVYKVDIKACFYNIYSRLGVDAQVICNINLQDRKIELQAVGQGRLTKYESELIKKLEHYKDLRNTVYGLTRASFVTLLKPNSNPKRQYMRGRLQNLDLTVIIASFLHAFVSKFRQYILYWNIDGGIIYPECFERMKCYLAELGFELKKEAEGEAIILGLGSYKVGDFYTAHFQHGVTSHKEKAEYLFSVTGVEKIEKLFRRMLCLKGE